MLVAATHIALAAALLCGCTGKDSAIVDSGDTGDSGDGYVSHDTSAWTDTSAPTDDTGDTGTTTGTTTTTPDLPYATDLALYPTTMVVAPTATWSMRLLATWDDGTVSEADADWTSEDETVATVDAAGIVTALEAGTTEIQAARDDLVISVPVEVRVDGLVTVHVIDAETGKAHAGARVRLGTDGPEGTADKTGKIELKWPPPDTIMVTAWDHERIPMTIVGAVQRELVVPIRAKSDVETTLGSISGAVDLDGVPSGGAGDLKFGIAAPSLVKGPLLLDPTLLVGAPREVTVYGVTANVPANIYIRDAAETYSVPAAQGSTGIWTIAAPLAISDITSGLAGATDAISLMFEDLDKVVWGWSDGATISAGGSGSADLAPATSLTESSVVDVGGLSVGFSGDEQALVLLGDVLPERGFSPVGIGVGTYDVDMHAAPVSLDGSTARVAAAIAQVGGLGAGTGYGICASWAAVEGDTTTLPELQQVPALDLFDPKTKAFTIETDGRARFVHVLVRGGEEGAYHEIVMDGGHVDAVLPKLGNPFGYGSTNWDLVAFETTQGTFHDMIREGWGSDVDIAQSSWTTGLLTQEP